MSDPTAPGGAAPKRHAKTYHLTAAGLVSADEPATKVVAEAPAAPAAPPADAPGGDGPAFPSEDLDQE